MFSDWVKARMATVGFSTRADLAREMGVTDKTITEVLNKPEQKRDPSLLIWLARTLMVTEGQLHDARSGRNLRQPTELARWDHYDRNARYGLQDIDPGMVRQVEQITGASAGEAVNRSLAACINAHQMLQHGGLATASELTLARHSRKGTKVTRAGST